MLKITTSKFWNCIQELLGRVSNDICGVGKVLINDFSHLVGLIITLLGSITMLCGTDNILWNILHMQTRSPTWERTPHSRLLWTALGAFLSCRPNQTNRIQSVSDLPFLVQELFLNMVCFISCLRLYVFWDDTEVCQCYQIAICRQTGAGVYCALTSRSCYMCVIFCCRSCGMIFMYLSLTIFTKCERNSKLSKKNCIAIAYDRGT